MAQTSSGGGNPATGSQPLSSLVGSLGPGYSTTSGNSTGLAQALSALSSGSGSTSMNSATGK